MKSNRQLIQDASDALIMLRVATGLLASQCSADTNVRNELIRQLNRDHRGNGRHVDDLMNNVGGYVAAVFIEYGEVPE